MVEGELTHTLVVVAAVVFVLVSTGTITPINPNVG